MTTVQEVSSRRYANVFDLEVEGPAEARGVCPGSEYIGGYGGVAWSRYFRDSVTGEVYRVRCSDGVNGGKDAHSDEDSAWLNNCYSAIIERCHRQAADGSKEIRISRYERVIMQGFVHAQWLETEAGKRDGVPQTTDGLEGGVVGMCHGVVVICDLSQTDDLPPRLHLVN